MAKQRIKKRLDRLYKSEIQALVRNLATKNKTVAITEVKERCPNCIWDVANKTSSGVYKTGGPKPFTGKRCPVCKNEGDVITLQRRTLQARVRFPNQTEPDEFLPEGEIPQDGAQIKVTIQQKKILDQATYYLIDDIRYQKVGPVRQRGLLTMAVALQMVKRDD